MTAPEPQADPASAHCARVQYEPAAYDLGITDDPEPEAGAGL
ncbi:MAG: hypothetical protein ACRDNT_28020 [Streptosporangiaceae bacterium]